MNNEVIEPTGIPFYSVKTGETHYAKLEPTIAAYINSSDLGINASRGQDYGWRLGSEWVNKVKAFKRNSTQMSILTAKNSGQKPTTVQILYYIYEEQLRDFYEAQEENENPFEEQYAQDVSGKGERQTTASTPAALQDEDEDDTADLIDDVLKNEPVTPPQTQATEPSKVPATEAKTATRSQKKQ